MITNDAVLFGILIGILACIFITKASPRPFWKNLYRFVPPLLLCYFLPSVLNMFGLVNLENSQLYYVASRFLLPAALILFTLNIDFKSLWSLGHHALIMFMVGTFSVVVGGIIAILGLIGMYKLGWLADIDPNLWRGMSTIAGSWIGGGANQTAMYEIFKPSEDLFSIMVTIDIVFANIWLGILLYGVGIRNKINQWLRSDNLALNIITDKVKQYHITKQRPTEVKHMLILSFIAFGGTALSHAIGHELAEYIDSSFPTLKLFNFDSPFFWIIILSTAFGMILSSTSLRQYEQFGASRWGTFFIYILITTIGIKMNVFALFSHITYAIIGLIWIIVHGIIMLTVGKLLRTPFFFIAVGSQANIGGVASAPIVASAFDHSLTTVGVLLAVLGYALGTYVSVLFTWFIHWIMVIIL